MVYISNVVFKLNEFHVLLCFRLLQEEFEDTKGVIKIEGQTSQWAKKNGQTAIDQRINRKLKIE
jgi:hypothetical protein